MDEIISRYLEELLIAMENGDNKAKVAIERKLAERLNRSSSKRL